MSLLPVEPAYRLAERSEEHRWLVTGLWSEQAVGIVGGEPKCCKSFLALDLAVAVAAGVPCLRRFAVPRAGRVLLFAAEDALHIVRRRQQPQDPLRDRRSPDHALPRRTRRDAAVPRQRCAAPRLHPH